MSDTPPKDQTDDDWYPDYDAPEDDDFADECGMGPDGQCSMAGSEWCDWDCPYNADLVRARIARMKKAQP